MVIQKGKLCLLLKSSVVDKHGKINEVPEDNDEHLKICN